MTELTKHLLFLGSSFCSKVVLATGDIYVKLILRPYQQFFVPSISQFCISFVVIDRTSLIPQIKFCTVSICVCVCVNILFVSLLNV